VRPGRAVDHSRPSSAAVMEEYSYTSTHPLGHIGPVTGSLHQEEISTFTFKIQYKCIKLFNPYLANLEVTVSS
jgi:hypothetical protein